MLFSEISDINKHSNGNERNKNNRRFDKFWLGLHENMISRVQKNPASNQRGDLISILGFNFL